MQPCDYSECEKAFLRKGRGQSACEDLYSEAMWVLLVREGQQPEPDLMQYQQGLTGEKPRECRECESLVTVSHCGQILFECRVCG